MTRSKLHTIDVHVTGEYDSFNHFMESNRSNFISKLLTIPTMQAEYNKQRGYYTEYIGDDWKDEYFRFDKPFFYEWIGKAMIETCFKEKDKNILQQPDEFYKDLLQ